MVNYLISGKVVGLSRMDNLQSDLTRTVELVEKFMQIGIAQEEAQRMMRVARYNRLYQQMSNVLDELKNVDGDQRRRLAALYSHPSVQVRLKAAIHTLLFVPKRAMQILQQNKDSNDFNLAADVYGMLETYQNGRYAPS